MAEYSADQVRKSWQEERKLFRRAARVWELLPLLGTRAIVPIQLFAMSWTELLAGVVLCTFFWTLLAARTASLSLAICLSVLSNALISVPANFACAFALYWTDHKGWIVAAGWTGITFLIEAIWPRGNTSVIERSLRKNWRQERERLQTEQPARAACREN